MKKLFIGSLPESKQSTSPAYNFRRKSELVMRGMVLYSVNFRIFNKLFSS